MNLLLLLVVNRGFIVAGSLRRHYGKIPFLFSKTGGPPFLRRAWKKEISLSWGSRLARSIESERRLGLKHDTRMIPLGSSKTSIGYRQRNPILCRIGLFGGRALLLLLCYFYFHY